MSIEKHIKDKQFIVLVGMNSQGKTYALNDFFKKHKEECIYIASETKADETIKNSVDSSPLIAWFQRLLDINKIEIELQSQINSIDLSEINSRSNINISLKSTAKNFKGLIAADVSTNSNPWKKAGSGETFLAELLLVEKMLSNSKNNPIKYLLIDEPETFLHPSLYLNICSSLKRISIFTKVIISTHSPEIANLISKDLSDILLVKEGLLTQLKTNKEYIDLIQKHPLFISDNLFSTTKEALTNIEDYFNIFLKPKLINCLFSKIVVLGEGLAEKILFDCFKEKFKDKEYSSSTHFETLFGKDFISFFADILISLNIQTVIIFDEDEYRIPIHKEINDYLKNNYHNIISFTNDLESHLQLEIKSDNKSARKSILVPLAIETAFVTKQKLLDDLLNSISQQIEQIYYGKIH